MDKSESSAAEDADQSIEKRVDNTTAKRTTRKPKDKGSSALSRRRRTVTN